MTKTKTSKKEEPEKVKKTPHVRVQTMEGWKRMMLKQGKTPQQIRG